MPYVDICWPLLIFCWPQIWTQQSRGHWGFLHKFLPISRLQTPCFLRWAWRPPKRVQTARTAGFFGILVASLEFRGVRAETIRVRSAQAGWMGWSAPRWSQGAVKTWGQMKGLDFRESQPRCHGCFFVELICVFFVCFPPAYGLEDQDIYM